MSDAIRRSTSSLPLRRFSAAAPSEAQPTPGAHRLGGDVFSFSPRPTGSVDQIRDQVQRIDRKVDSLEGQLERSAALLERARSQQSVLEAELERKIAAYRQITGSLGSARREKAALEAEISELKGQIGSLNQEISRLAVAHAGLEAKAGRLSSAHREAYDDAMGADNYARYLATLPGMSRAEGSLDEARAEAASRAASQARRSMGQLEGQLRTTNGALIRNEQAQESATFRRSGLFARGQAVAGTLERTEDQIDRLRGQQQRAHGGVLDTSTRVDANSAKIRQAQDNISGLKSQIGELEAMRDELLAAAINARQADAKRIAAQVEQLKRAIEGLKGELRSNERELSELRALRN